ncbi:MAG TPA: plastocyanin/azurin family copper-binding protein [Solirubrobacterales bacterium]|nr:plastocyanin/azurin family copper-binding protein [Solirubrobacterales bacterium]
MKRFTLLLVVCVLAVFGLAACGGDDNNDSTTEPAATDTTTTETTTTGEGGGGGETVRVSADPGGALEFEQKSLTAPVGSVTVEFRNPSSTPHDFVLERDGQEVAKTDVISDGEDTADATLEAGEYTYYCSVPGHRQAGMEGTLTAE